MNNSLLDKIISEINNKNYSSAITGCNELISGYPENLRLYELRALCLYAVGDYDSAEDDLNLLVDHYKESDDDPALLGALYNRRAKNFMKKHNWASAVDDFVKSLNINENVAEVHNNLAICYRRVGNYEDAYLHASKALELNNDFAEAYNNRANINICLFNHEDALSDYTKSISLNPGNPKTYFNRGSIYYEVFRDYENAREDFLAAIRINPDYENEIVREYPEFKELLFESGNESEETEFFDDSIDEYTSEENKFEDDKEYDKQEDNVEDEFSVHELNEAEPDEINDSDENKISEELPSEFDSPDSINEENHEESTAENENKQPEEEIIVPQFDFKSMLGNAGEDDSQYVEEQNQSELKPVISEDVIKLHDEIIADTGSAEKEDHSENKTEITQETEHGEIKKPKPYVPSYRKEKDKGFIGSPYFFVTLIVLILAVISLVVVRLYLNEEPRTVTENTVQQNNGQGKEERNQINESKEQQTPTENEKIESVPEDKQSKDEPKQELNTQPVLESKNLGLIGSKQTFVLFSEPDGYYVQIGSFKEKSKAEVKLNSLKKKNVNGIIVEADLKEKGIYYRVRAGSFKSEDEAKQVTLKLE